MAGQDIPAHEDVVEGTVIDETPAPAASSRAPNRGLYAVIVALLLAAGGLGFVVWQDRIAAKGDALALGGDVAALQQQLAQQAAQLATLQQKVTAADSARTALVTQLETGQTTAAQAVADVTTMASNLDAMQKDIRSELDALAARLSSDGAALALETTDSVSGASVDAGQEIPVSAPPLDHARLIAHTELVVMNGIMMQNQTGQSLLQWQDMIADLVAAGAPAPRWAPLRTAIAAAPPSAALLVGEGADIVTAGSAALHSVEADASPVDRMVTALRRFVRLRPADGTSTATGSDVTRFEDALRTGDLAAAVAVADTWQAGSIEGVANWQQAATARLALDQAVRDVTADIIAQLAPPVGAEGAN